MKPKTIINMKQHLLKNSFLRGVLCLLLCVVGMGNAWGEEYKLITSTSELVAGEKYIIASMADGSGFVMTNYVSGGNNWKTVAATTTSSTITFQNGMATLTLGGSSNAWTFHNGTYYMDATATTSNNHLKGSSDVDKYNKFSISFSNDAAVITCTGKDSRNILRYNSQSKLFACYSSGQLPVYLYKKIDEPEQTKTVTSLSISETPSNTTYYVGEEPSAEGLKVTATYSDNTTNVVTSSVSWSYTPATITSGTKYFTATASYEGKEATSEPFNITVKSIVNTAESAYTVAQACTYIDAGKGLSEEVYVKGIVSQVDEFNEKYGSITYWISDDGTTTSQQFQCYSGLNIGETLFTSINDLKLGTDVVVIGMLKKYNAIYEFDKNNVIISKDETNARTLSSIEISGTPTKTSYYVGDTPSAEGLTVNAVYSDDSKVEVTEDVTWTFNPETIAEGTRQVTATASYNGMTAYHAYSIVAIKNPKITDYTQLEDGKKYYIVATKNDIDYFFNTPYTVTIDIRNTGSTNKNNATIVTAIANKSSNNKWAFQFSNGNYLSLPDTDNNGYISIVSSEIYWTLSNDTKEQLIRMTTDGTHYLQINSGGYYYFGSYKSTQTNIWFLEVPTYDVEISSAGLATFCLPYNATVPEGLTAYTATDNGESVKLTAKEGGKIAAGEGVVLKGDEGTYTFVAAEGSVSATAGNQMVGVTEDTELTEADNAYMLTRKKDDGSIAFRLLATDYTLGANKAYLKLENNARNLISVVWDDNATGIYDLSEKEEAENGAIYNLAGQKLMRTQKGINIINGKLVIK